MVKALLLLAILFALLFLSSLGCRAITKEEWNAALDQYLYRLANSSTVYCSTSTYGRRGTYRTITSCY